MNLYLIVSCVFVCCVSPVLLPRKGCARLTPGFRLRKAYPYRRDHLTTCYRFQLINQASLNRKSLLNETEINYQWLGVLSVLSS